MTYRIMQEFLLKICICFYAVFFCCNSQLDEWKIPCNGEYKPQNCNENISLFNIEDFERCAPALLPVNVREYIWHGSVSEKTFWENKKAFSRFHIKQRTFQNVANYTTETTILGEKINIPIGISPTMLQSDVHKDGETGVAKAAENMKSIYVLNIFGGTTIEDLADNISTKSRLWMQTYLFKNKSRTADIVKRAEKAGFSAIVVTVNDFIPKKMKCNVTNILIHEFQKKKNFARNIQLQSGEHFSDIERINPLEQFKWLCNYTKLPVVAKGILSGDDAVLAIHAGASAIMVSNQGGRIIDGGIATIDVLSEVLDAVKKTDPKVEVYVDGGIRFGRDVLVALAKGATAAFIGRPALWGLAVDGQKGVESVLTILKEELEATMLQSGSSSVQNIKNTNLYYSPLETCRN